jgi:hypothetical protein
MATVLEVLERGRELYAAAPSHVPDPDIPRPGTHCVVTAIFADGRRLHNPAEFAQAAMVKAVAGNSVCSLVHWNAEHTTEEVLAAFDRAIETERERCHIPDGRVLALA